jgi:hypothetical protein
MTKRHIPGGGRALAALFLSVAMLLPAAHAQGRTKRLILTDGTVQPVSQYEVKGDRVRYLSAERHEWEEVPASLVDWKATEGFNSGQQSAAEALEREQEEAERKAEESASPEVAPGIRLPVEGGVFLLDRHQGEAAVVELRQSGGEVNRQRGKNILRSILNPLPTGVRQTIELKGAHARVQAHTGELQIFLNVDYGEDGTSPGGETITFLPRDQRYKIVRLQAKGDRRVAANLKVGFTGTMKETRDVAGARVETFTADWVRVTPEAPLEPGEYALVEMLTPEQMNLFVWDFGVDRDAPANSGAMKAAATAPAREGEARTKPAVVPRTRK